MASEVRNRAARMRAEETLVRFALLSGDHSKDFVVIGGLNPDFLTLDPPVPHQGTTDIDLLFTLGVDERSGDQDFSWIDDAIEIGGFVTENKWRWRAVLGKTPVLLEFLCDVWDHTADTYPLPGSTKAVACKLAGPAAALTEPITRELVVTEAVRKDFPEAPAHVSLRFANLGGYLLAKAAAANSRRLPKDKYDLMFVILYNEGGAKAAARAVAEQLKATEDFTDPDEIRNVVANYRAADSSWVSKFAETMISTGDESPEDQIRNEAVFGAKQFLEELDRPA